jgi:hypothetical protein
MSDSPEPFVILDRPGLPAPRRWTVLGGRKPAVLLVDHGGAEGAGLDLPLAREGFDVYRTTGRDSALDLLCAHPTMLMALVRLDLPGLDGVGLLGDLEESLQGLWMGQLCDPAERDLAAAGYAAGAADLFSPRADPAHTIARLVRSVPWALRRRAEAERRLQRRRERASLPWFRRAARSARVRLPRALPIAVALAAGVALAALAAAWQESRERDDARIERVLGALDALRPRPPDRGDRMIERWQRQEQIDLERRGQETMGAYYRAQLEEERLRDLMRFVTPSYPKH